MKTSSYVAESHSCGWRSAILAGLLLVAGCGGGGGGGDAVTEPPNRAPIARDDNLSMPSAGQAMTVSVLVNDNDPDGDSLLLMSVSAPLSGAASINDNATPNPADDFIDYTAPATAGANDSFTYTIGDGQGATSTATVWLSPYSPVAVALDDNVTTPVDTTLGIAVLDNDTGPDGGTLAIVTVSSPSHGTVTINGNGTPATDDDFLEYVPDSAYAGPDSFLYTISDGVVSDQAAINVMVGNGATRTVSGSYMLGPVADARVQVFPVDAMGVLASSDVVAQSFTNENGSWMLPLPDSDTAWVAIASGGSMLDPSDLSSPREIAFNPGDKFEVLVPPGDDHVAMTVFASALLKKSRSETSAPNFLAVFEDNRGLATSGFGFDVVTTLPVDTITPDLDAPVAERQYALGNGGLSLAMNALSDALGMSAPDFPVINAMAEDLADCRLDGLNDGAGVIVNVNGLLTPMPGAFDLNTEIVRFRNNNFGIYGNTTLLEISASLCGQTVSIPNLVPVAVDDSTVVSEDSSIVVDVLANDDPGDAPTSIVSVTPTANGSALLGSSSISYSPNPDFNGADSFTYTIRDAFGEQSTANVSVTVTAVNDPPVLLSAIGNQNALENAVYSLDISGRFFDADGESLIFTAIGLPASLSMSTAGVITGTPTNADFLAPPFAVTVNVEDGAGISINDSFTLDVINPNFAPTISDIANQVVAEDMGTGPLVFTIDDVETAPDSLLITVTTSNPAIASLENIVLGGSGSSRTINVTPEPEQSGLVTITVSVSDGNNSANDSFVIDVGIANDQPVITGQNALTVIEEGSLSIAFSDLTVDDPDNLYPADFTLSVQDGANYSRVGNTITAAAEFNGDLTVGVTVNDGLLDSPVFNLTVTVTALNDAPVIAGQNPVSLLEDDDYTIVLTDLNVTDPDDSYPSGFTLSVQAGANYTHSGNTITPDPNFSGSLSVPVSVNDGDDESDPFNLDVTVNPMNDMPEITGQAPISIPEFLPATIDINDLTVNDPDNSFPGDFALTVLTGSNYSVTGADEITPDANFVGTLMVSVLVNDGLIDSAVFDLTIDVIDVPDRDNDGVGDELERRVGGNPDAAEERYVHIDPGSLAASPDGTTWALAYPHLAAAVADSAIKESPTPGQLSYLLIANNTSIPSSDPNWTLNLAGSCDNMMFFGSLGVGMTEADRPNGDPSTRLQSSTFGSRVVNIDGCQNIQFLNITIANGAGVTSGAGMRVSAASNKVSLYGVLFENNVATRTGGGLSILTGSAIVNVDDCDFRNNFVFGPGEPTPMGGGGIYSGNGVELSLDNTRVVNNGVVGPASGRAGGGGAYLNGVSASVVRRSTFSANWTDRNGGGLHVDGSFSTAEVSIEDSVVSGNDAGNVAGGVYVRRTGVEVSVFNNLLMGNVADDGGAMAAFENDASDVRNNTMVYNHSRAGNGAAMAMNDLTGGTYPGPFVFNNIFNRNLNLSMNTRIMSYLNGANITCLENIRDRPPGAKCGASNPDVDPLFTNGFYLAAGSPAVDASSVSSGSVGLDAGPLTTNVSGALDSSRVDFGYHYRGGYAGFPVLNADGYVQVDPTGTVAVNPSIFPDRLVIEPQVAGTAIGSGHEIVVSEQPSSVSGVTFDFVSPASPGGDLMLTDLGDGTYQLLFRAANSGDIRLDLTVDGLAISPPIVIGVVP